MSDIDSKSEAERATEAVSEVLGGRGRNGKGNLLGLPYATHCECCRLPRTAFDTAYWAAVPSAKIATITRAWVRHRMNCYERKNGRPMTPSPNPSRPYPKSPQGADEAEEDDEEDEDEEEEVKEAKKPASAADLRSSYSFREKCRANAAKRPRDSRGLFVIEGAEPEPAAKKSRTQEEEKKVEPAAPVLQLMGPPAPRPPKPVPRPMVPEKPKPLAGALDGLASGQKQVLEQLAKQESEIQVSLRHVEKLAEEYKAHLKEIGAAREWISRPLPEKPAQLNGLI